MSTASSTEHQYVVGVDYGTLSGRALVVRVSDGAELGSAVLEYPHGVVDTVDAAATWDEETGAVAVFLVNRHPESELRTS